MPKCKILVSEPLRRSAGDKHRVMGTGDTVGEACASLAQGYPELLRGVFRDDGRLRNGVTVFLNGADIRHTGGLDAAISEGDVINLHAPMLVG